MSERGTSAASLRTRVVDLGSEPSLNFYDLAIALAELHERDVSLLRDVPDATGMSRRRVYYLLSVGQLMIEHRITRKTAGRDRVDEAAAARQIPGEPRGGEGRAVVAEAA